MAVPNLARFSAQTHFTAGLTDTYPGYQDVLDGVGIVTGWLSTEGWEVDEPVSTTWTNVYATVSTTWTEIAA